jgi:hypothetical protein
VKRKGLLWGSVGALAILIQPFPSHEIEKQGTAALAFVQARSEGSAAERPPAGRGGSPRTQLEGLPCFDCHNIERYREGAEFAHSKHENVGHCHVCHAFKGHFQATIRRKTCEGCH